MTWIKKIFRSYNDLRDHDRVRSEKDISEMQGKFRSVDFSFREGFSGRVTGRLENILETHPEELLYKNLSGFLPRIISISFAVLVITIVAIFALHGTISPEKMIGADRVDESNFISYLFMQK
jgi:hypothetical protein